MRVSGLILSATAAFLILVGLGTWQLQRRAEKLDLIQRHEAAMKAPAHAFPSSAQWPATDFSKLEYAKVTVEGHFLPLPEVHLYALLPKIQGRHGGVGWWVIMPFELNDGGVVFINRGFVPQELKHPSLRPKSLAPSSTQTIEGIVRLKEEPNHFTPASEPKTNEWYLRDPAAFAAYESIETSQKIAPVVIDQTTANADGLPQPAESAAHFANNHLQYAFTWYALAIVLVVMTFLFRRRRRKMAQGETGLR